MPEAVTGQVKGLQVFRSSYNPVATSVDLLDHLIRNGEKPTRSQTVAPLVNAVWGIGIHAGNFIIKIPLATIGYIMRFAGKGIMESSFPKIQDIFQHAVMLLKLIFNIPLCIGSVLYVKGAVKLLIFTGMCKEAVRAKPTPPDTNVPKNQIESIFGAQKEPILELPSFVSLAEALVALPPMDTHIGQKEQLETMRLYAYFLQLSATWKELPPAIRKVVNQLGQKEHPDERDLLEARRALQGKSWDEKKIVLPSAEQSQKLVEWVENQWNNHSETDLNAESERRVRLGLCFGIFPCSDKQFKEHIKDHIENALAIFGFKQAFIITIFNEKNSELDFLTKHNLELLQTTLEQQLVELKAAPIWKKPLKISKKPTTITAQELCATQKECAKQFFNEKEGAEKPEKLHFNSEALTDYALNSCFSPYQSGIYSPHLFVADHPLSKPTPEQKEAIKQYQIRYLAGGLSPARAYGATLPFTKPPSSATYTYMSSSYSSPALPVSKDVTQLITGIQDLTPTQEEINTRFKEVRSCFHRPYISQYSSLNISYETKSPIDTSQYYIQKDLTEAIKNKFVKFAEENPKDLKGKILYTIQGLEILQGFFDMHAIYDEAKFGSTAKKISQEIAVLKKSLKKVIV